jgi:class 3 adenylate cyclase
VRYVANNISHASYLEVSGDEGYAFLGDIEPIVHVVERFLTGTSATTTVSDRLLATVLFTDIVDSTVQATTLGDHTWSQRLDDHNDVVRRQLERFRGREINTTGDGFLATFDGPARAIQCAVAIRDRCRVLGIELRAGLHIGEVEIRADGIAGLTVHIGARVAALAAPGEVLVSRTVVDLVAGSGIHFEDRGEHELKGVPGSWQLYSVTA